jgi:hypothetical protein
MMDRYGGMERFVGQWYQDICEARLRAPGSKTVLDASKAIANFILKSTQMRQERELAALSDDELAQEMRRMFVEFTLSNTINASAEKLAIAVAHQHNLTVDMSPQSTPGNPPLTAEHAALMAVMGEAISQAAPEGGEDGDRIGDSIADGLPAIDEAGEVRAE